MALGIRKQTDDSYAIKMIILTPEKWLIGSLPAGNEIEEKINFRQFSVLSRYGVNVFQLLKFVKLLTIILHEESLKQKYKCVLCT